MANEQLLTELKAAFERFMVVLERIEGSLQIAYFMRAQSIPSIGTPAETPPAPDVVSTLPISMAASTPAAVPSYTYDDICAAINGYADRHGHLEAKKKLTAEFGAAYFKAVKPEQYADVIKAFS
jgi:hypothetical protein